MEGDQSRSGLVDHIGFVFLAVQNQIVWCATVNMSDYPAVIHESVRDLMIPIHSLKLEGLVINETAPSFLQ
jgi:hypothetical protein